MALGMDAWPSRLAEWGGLIPGLRRHFIVVSTLMTFGGCGVTDPPVRETMPFEARIDSVTAPAAILGSDSLRIVVFGYLGPNGCWDYDRVERRRDGSQLFLTAFGVHVLGEDLASQTTLSFFQVDLVEAPVSSPGSVEILAEQGDTLLFLAEVEVQ